MGRKIVLDFNVRILLGGFNIFFYYLVFGF